MIFIIAEIVFYRIVQHKNQSDLGVFGETYKGLRICWETLSKIVNGVLEFMHAPGPSATDSGPDPVVPVVENPPPYEAMVCSCVKPYRDVAHHLHSLCSRRRRHRMFTSPCLTQHFRVKWCIQELHRPASNSGDLMVFELTSRQYFWGGFRSANIDSYYVVP